VRARQPRRRQAPCFISGRPPCKFSARCSSSSTSLPVHQRPSLHPGQQRPPATKPRPASFPADRRPLLVASKARPCFSPTPLRLKVHHKHATTTPLRAALRRPRASAKRRVAGSAPPQVRRPPRAAGSVRARRQQRTLALSVSVSVSDYVVYVFVHVSAHGTPECLRARLPPSQMHSTTPSASSDSRSWRQLAVSPSNLERVFVTVRPVYVVCSTAAMQVASSKFFSLLVQYRRSTPAGRLFLVSCSN
jgi:hypothetical protein